MQGFARVSFLRALCRREIRACTVLFSLRIASRAMRVSLLRESITATRAQLLSFNDRQQEQADEEEQPKLPQKNRNCGNFGDGIDLPNHRSVSI